MQNWIRKENKNYLDFFSRDSKSFLKLRDCFAEHLGQKDHKKTYFWRYHGATFALIEDDTENSYSLWKQEGDSLPKFLLDYNTPTSKSVIVEVTPSPKGVLVLFVTAIKGDESRSIQIFDCRSLQFLDTLIKNVSALPLFLKDDLHFYALRHDRLNRPKSLVRVEIDSKNTCRLSRLFSDHDPHFFYRLISWSDQTGLLFIGKSITAVKIYCFPYSSGEQAKPAARSFLFPCGITLATADNTSLFVATNNDEGACLMRTHPAKLNVSLSVLWMNQSQRFVHALGQTSRYAFMVLNNGPLFSLLAIDRATGKQIDVLIPKKFELCHFSIIHTEGDQQVLIKAQSLVQAQQILRWDLGTGKIDTYEKTKPIATLAVEHDHMLFESQISFNASDGMKIPISLACLRSHLQSRNGKPNKPMPSLVYIYGCYGRVTIPDYSPFRNRLIRAGAIYIVIHVRGGGEFGPEWHRKGMGQNKIRAVLDLIEGIEWLIAEGYIAEDKIVGCGRSAAGILLALAINLRPGLFNGLALESPFLDLYGSMSNSKLPLTLAEDMEWSMTVDDVQSHLRSLCPLSTVRRQIYMDILIQCGSRDWRSPVMQIKLWLEAVRSNSINQSNQIVYVCRDSGHQLQKNLDHLTEWYFFIMAKMDLISLM